MLRAKPAGTKRGDAASNPLPETAGSRVRRVIRGVESPKFSRPLELTMKRNLLASVLLLLTLTALAASQVYPQRVRASDSVMAALVAKKVDPVYPPTAKQARIQGVVILKV